MKRFCLIFIGILCLILLDSKAFATGPFGRALCKSEGYICLKIHGRQNWENLFPNSTEREEVMEINRMNTEIYSGMTIALPKHLDSNIMQAYSPFPAQIKSTGQKVIYVDPTVLAWGAYDQNGSLVRWGGASLGSDYCRDLGHRCHSPVGTFHVYEKGSVDCVSTKFPLPYGGAPMPYCMYFHGGFALHGEPHGVPGDNASHGCVRMFVDDAAWLSKNFVEVGTEVIIGPYGPFNHPAASKIEPPDDGTSLIHSFGNELQSIRLHQIQINHQS